MSDSESKPVVPDLTNKITVIVRHEDKDVKIALKPNHLMQKLFEASGRAFQMDQNTLRFVYDGKRLRESDTAASLEMEDGDEISAFVMQVGGS